MSRETKGDFLASFVLLVLMPAALILVFLVLTKMFGMWPVSRTHLDWFDQMIDEHPNLDTSTYRRIRDSGLYFSESDRDMILKIWTMQESR